MTSWRRSLAKLKPSSAMTDRRPRLRRALFVIEAFALAILMLFALFGGVFERLASLF